MFIEQVEINTKKLAWLACSALTKAVTAERNACSHLWRFRPSTPTLFCIRCGAATTDRNPGQNAPRADSVPQSVLQYLARESA